MTTARKIIDSIVFVGIISGATGFSLMIKGCGTSSTQLRNEIMDCETKFSPSQFDMAFNCLSSKGKELEQCAMVGGTQAALNLLACVIEHHMNNNCVKGCPFHGASKDAATMLDRSRREDSYSLPSCPSWISARITSGGGSYHYDWSCTMDNQSEGKK